MSDRIIKLDHDNQFKFDVVSIGTISGRVRVSLRGNTPNDIDITYKDGIIPPAKRIMQIHQTLADRFPDIDPGTIKDVVNSLDIFAHLNSVQNYDKSPIVKNYSERAEKITMAYRHLIESLVSDMIDELDAVTERAVERAEEEATAALKNKL